MFCATFSQQVWQPAATEAQLPGVTFHTLRHSFVAILVAAGCNVREVSEWAGHNSVAFTLTRYGGLFEDDTDRGRRAARSPTESERRASLMRPGRCCRGLVTADVLTFALVRIGLNW